MLICKGLYMFNECCVQYCPCKLIMQSCALCLHVRCGSSNQIHTQKKKRCSTEEVEKGEEIIFYIYK